MFSQKQKCSFKGETGIGYIKHWKKQHGLVVTPLVNNFRPREFHNEELNNAEFNNEELKNIINYHTYSNLTLPLAKMTLSKRVKCINIVVLFI